MKEHIKRYFRVTDDAIQSFIGTLLRVGVFISASVVLLGAILFFAQHNHVKLSYAVFTSEPHYLSTVSTIISSAFQFQGIGMIQLGILLLIATPIARVIFSLFAFLLEKDYLYVSISIVVLTILLYSLSGG